MNEDNKEAWWSRGKTTADQLKGRGFKSHKNQRATSLSIGDMFDNAGLHAFYERQNRRVRDYQESKKRHRNDVITFRLITPIKRNDPLQNNIFYPTKLLSLNFCFRICD